ncbi:MAG TPA: transporter substrate-binding domain-containing protein [Anaerolineae bacterium]|nr:transporter substrate-binding domain-containing protein [Anaerolineae bacterium]
MMMRGSVLALLHLLLEVALLIGCAPNMSTPPPIVSAPTPAPLPPGTSIPQRIRARGYLIVGVRYDLPPFCSVTEEGTLAGFEVDLGRELARRWLGSPDAVRFRQVRSDTAVEHLLAGEVDLALATLTHTQEREEQVDFGPTYFLDGQALLVRASDALTITGPANLAGRLVGVVEGSGAAEALASTVEFTPTFQMYAVVDRAIEGLVNGEVDAVADLHRRLVRGLSPGSGLQVLGPYIQAPVAAAYPPDEPGFADLVALTFQEMWSDGTLADLYGRWFPGAPWPYVEIWPGATTVTLEEAEGIGGVSGTVDAVRSRGRLQVAMIADRPPFAYIDAAGAPAGYEVRLVSALAELWLGDPLAVDLLPVTLDEGMRMLRNGEADLLIGAVPHTQEAELSIDFSLTIYVAGESMMVQAGSAVEGIAGLDGQQVAVVSGSGSVDVLRRVAQDLQVFPVIVPKATLEEAIAALEGGEVVAVVGERTELLGPAYATPGLGVTALRLTQVPLALGLPPGDSAFRDLVNLTLQAMVRDGTFAAIYGEWFDDPPPEIERWPGSPVQPLRLISPAP